LYLTAVPNVRSEIITSSLVHAILALIGVTPTALAPPPLGKKLDFRNVAEIPVPRCLLLSEAVLRDGPCRYGLLRVWLNLLVCEEDVKREENVSNRIQGVESEHFHALYDICSSIPRYLPFYYGHSCNSFGPFLISFASRSTLPSQALNKPPPRASTTPYQAIHPRIQSHLPPPARHPTTTIRCSTGAWRPARYVASPPYVPRINGTRSTKLQMFRREMLF